MSAVQIILIIPYQAVPQRTHLKARATFDLYTKAVLVENLSNVAPFLLASEGSLDIPAQVARSESVTVVSSESTLVVVLALARHVVEGVAGAAGGEPDADEGAGSVVAPLALQTVVLTRHALVDVLALAALVLVPSRTRVLHVKLLTGVVALSVHTDRVLGTVVSLLGTLVDVDAGDQEEGVPRGTLLVPAARLLDLTDVGADGVVTDLVRLGAGVERLLAFVHVVTDVDEGVVLEPNRADVILVLLRLCLWDLW